MSRRSAAGTAENHKALRDQESGWPGEPWAGSTSCTSFSSLCPTRELPPKAATGNWSRSPSPGTTGSWARHGQAPSEAFHTFRQSWCTPGLPTPPSLYPGAPADHPHLAHSIPLSHPDSSRQGPLPGEPGPRQPGHRGHLLVGKANRAAQSPWACERVRIPPSWAVSFSASAKSLSLVLRFFLNPRSVNTHDFHTCTNTHTDGSPRSLPASRHRQESPGKTCSQTHVPCAPTATPPTLSSPDTQTQKGCQQPSTHPEPHPRFPPRPRARRMPMLRTRVCLRDKTGNASLSSTQLCEHRCVPSPHAHSSRGSHAWRGPKGLNNQRLPLAWASRSWTRHELGAGIRFFLRTGKTERETCHNEGWTAGRRPRSPASWNRAGSLRSAPSPAPLWLGTLLVTCLTTRATAQKRDSVTPN